MKRLLLSTSILAALACAPAVHAQMSMDEQIARIYQAEQEIKALDAAKEQEREQAAKKAADVQRRAQQAKQKQQAAQRQAQQQRQEKLQAYEDQEREINLELKKLDLELMRAQVDYQKKLAQSRSEHADEFVQAELEEARSKVQTLQAQSSSLRQQKAAMQP